MSIAETLRKLWSSRWVKAAIAGIALSGTIVTWVVGTTESGEKLAAMVSKLFGIDAYLDKAPVSLGDTIEHVHEILGPPTAFSNVGEEYFSLGLTVFPEYGDSTVVGGLVAARLPSGVAFEGRLNGIELGMSFSDVTAELGDLTFWAVRQAHPPIAIWKKDAELTIVHFESDGSASSPKAVRITQCKESSVAAYHAIVTASLQELGAGRVCDYFQEFASAEEAVDLPGAMTFEEFRSQYGGRPYEIVEVETTEVGGAMVYLLYDNDELLKAWVYPLSWEQPSIRLIVNFGAPALAAAANQEERAKVLATIRALRSGGSTR